MVFILKTSREMLTANDDQIGVTHKDVLDCYYEIKELDTVEIKHMDDPSVSENDSSFFIKNLI